MALAYRLYMPVWPLFLADPGGEGVGEPGRVGVSGQLGDLVVVLQLVDQDRDGTVKDLGDHAVGMELLGSTDIQAGDVAAYLIRSGVRFGAFILSGIPQAIGADPCLDEFGADGVTGLIADDGELVLQPERVVPACPSSSAGMLKQPSDGPVSARCTRASVL
jgi:hypothetical protein